MIFSLSRVKGKSMSPKFNEGDFILSIKKPFFKIKKGDSVIFYKEPYGKMLKDVKEVYKNSLFVLGTHPHSSDSRVFGKISKKDVEAKVLFKIKARK